MKKLLATLITGFLVTSSFAQAPAAPGATSATAAAPKLMPKGEGTVDNMKATTAKPKHAKHAKKEPHAAAAAK